MVVFLLAIVAILLASILLGGVIALVLLVLFNPWIKGLDPTKKWWAQAFIILGSVLGIAAAATYSLWDSLTDP